MKSVNAKVVRVLEWSGFGLGAAVVGLLGVCGAVVIAVSDTAPMMFGNRTDVLATASADGPQFRFAVLGDTQKGTTGLRRMLAHLQPEGAAFYVHTGDLVSDNDGGHYRLAKWTLTRAKLDTPMLVAPGNHDVKGGTGLFEKHVGPMEVAWPRGAVRFLIVDDALGDPPPTHRLEKRLRAAGEAPIVLFMHQPPWDVTSESFRVTPGFEDVVALIRKYRVRYVFSGHVHRYRRLEQDGTVYVANGIGGDYEHWKLGTKVHATVVEVNGRAISDRPVELEPSHSVWDNIEHLALGHVAETYRRSPIWTWAATAAILAGWTWLVVRLWRRARKKTA